jgi:transcription factor MYB, plant
LPGRTDNEIKNYWRTHMRKKAQERKSNTSPSSSSSSLTYQSGYPDPPPIIGTEGQELHGGSGSITSILKGTPSDMDGYPMDQIWMEIEEPEVPPSATGLKGDKLQDHAYSSIPGPLVPSAGWDYYYPEACWKMDDEIKMAAQFGYSEGGAGPCF